MCNKHLGDISKKYESGNLGCSAISSTPGDPGGASYGTYQLASATGTLTEFLKDSAFGDRFKGLKPGTPLFNQMWLACSCDPKFCDEQHTFIQDTKFNPVLNYWEMVLKLDTSDAIDEALWSIGVQHGNFKKILSAAYDLIPETYTDKDCINALYDARANYVWNLTTLTPALKKSLNNRYVAERQDVLNLVK
jgi:hypothetical protein